VDGKMAAEKKNGEDLGPKAGAQLGKIVNLMSEFFFFRFILDSFLSAGPLMRTP
jgi:hypothetical protein